MRNNPAINVIYVGATRNPHRFNLIKSPSSTQHFSDDFYYWFIETGEGLEKQFLPSDTVFLAPESIDYVSVFPPYRTLYSSFSNIYFNYDGVSPS